MLIVNHGKIGAGLDAVSFFTRFFFTYIVLQFHFLLEFIRRIMLRKKKCGQIFQNMGKDW